jgi:II/X family phage/plasmid replication protein
MAPNKNAISKYVGYLQLNNSSEVRKQKIYYKAQELAADFEKSLKLGKKDKAAILGDKRLHDFADGRMRFEATTGSRALQDMGIPTLLNEFLKFHDWYEQVHGEPLCRYLWHKCFDKYFAQLKGHSMKNVDDDSIKLRIQMKYDVPKTNLKTGKVVVCRRKSNALWNTYRSIKAEGYEQLAKENSSTFFRNVKHLVDAGLSRAFLKSLDPFKPNENVIALVQVVNIDFGCQRPAWYQEPKAGFEDKRRHLRLVG